MSKLPSTYPQATFENKSFLKKVIKFVFFLKLSNKFWHLGAFLCHSSHEKVISMCSEDEFKKNWEYKFFLSLSYLQLIFPAPRLEIRGGGRQFSMYASCGTMGASKKSCKINTLFVVFGHWVIEWKFVFELWVEKKWQELKNAFNRSKKTVWGEIFLKKTVTILYHFQILAKKFNMLAINCSQDRKNCIFVQKNTVREKIFLDIYWKFITFSRSLLNFDWKILRFQVEIFRQGCHNFVLRVLGKNLKKTDFLL